MVKKAADPSVQFLTKSIAELKLSCPPRFKEKTQPGFQIIAEQIILEALELQGGEPQEAKIRPRTQNLTAVDLELVEFVRRCRRRNEFEDLIQRDGWNTSVWLEYAQWEETQNFDRARAVWERALAVNSRNTTLWLKYGEMEMKHRFVHLAWNVWERAVSLLPGADQLWYKYIHLEEMLGNVVAVRKIFERWMASEPGQHGWTAYVEFELRYHELHRARAIFERYAERHPTAKALELYAKFEVENGEVAKARSCHEKGISQLGDDVSCMDELVVALEKLQ